MKIPFKNNRRPIRAFLFRCAAIRLTAAAGLIVFFALSLHAQPTPAQLERVATLVEQGKIESAKLLAETLLEIHPGDPQLTKIQKLLANAPQAAVQPATTTAAGQSGGAGSAAGGTAQRVQQAAPAALSGMDRLEIQTVITGAEQAMTIGDANARATKLRELLARSVPAAAVGTTDSQWAPYWQARAVAALTIDDYKSGWQAGQALLRLDALNSQDASLTQVMANLNLKGWLRSSTDEIVKAQTAVYEAWLGRWVGEGRYNGPISEGAAYGTRAMKEVFVLDIQIDDKLQPVVRIENSESSTTYFTKLGGGPATSPSRGLIRNIPGDGELPYGKGRVKYKITNTTFDEQSRILTVEFTCQYMQYSLPTSAEEWRFKLSSDHSRVIPLSKIAYVSDENGNPYMTIKELVKKSK